MPALHLKIGEVPVIISANSPSLVKLFADYFRYYDPKIEASIGELVGELVRSLRCPANFSLPEAPGSSVLSGNRQTSVCRTLSEEGSTAPLVIELKMRREMPLREELIPSGAELFSQTGVVGLWREKIEDQRFGSRERFYFDLSVAAFRVEPHLSRATGLISPQALEHPQILANTYALFALLLLLRRRELYHLHAAAVVSPQDELWLICGSQRSGKTTLATALGIAGWRPISDDSLLIGFDGEEPRLAALKKYFHVGDELLARWRELDEMTIRHQSFDRACVEGLEFFGTRILADEGFDKIDRIVLPEITGEERSRAEPIPRSEAILRLAEQSMFFQLWREHTKRQWEALTALAAEASCHRLLAGRDILSDPSLALRVLKKTQNVERT